MALPVETTSIHYSETQYLLGYSATQARSAAPHKPVRNICGNPTFDRKSVA
jgi:hypothetical protein